MADYKLLGPDDSNGVQRLSDGAFIPNDVGNKDWNKYLKYVDKGGVTDPFRLNEEEKTYNSAKAQRIQNNYISQVTVEEDRVKIGLPDRISNNDMKNLTDEIVRIQADIDNPLNGEYNPPIITVGTI